MAWWIALAGVEIGWVLGVCVVLRDTEAAAGGSDAPGEPAGRSGSAPHTARAVFVWAYWLYHLPLLIVDNLSAGWAGQLLEGRGAWLLAQALIIGVVTVVAYGTILTWLLI